MKNHRLLKNLGRVANILGLVFLVASAVLNVVPLQPAQAKNPGAIWTTSNACGDLQQDVNHFEIGDHVYINGSGFLANTSYAWTITGKPGGASGDPNIDVASDNYTTDSSGAFCFDAYTVAGDDWGEYQVKFGDKGDNYQVDAAEPAPALTLAKSADPTTYNLVGDVISYTYTVTNSGNVALDGPVTVTDDKATVSCPSGDLALGAYITCTASYAITQGDLDAGSVTNHATASASYDGEPVNSNQAQATVNALSRLGISLEKSADPATYAAVGDVISYTYVITNTGNVILAGSFSVTDDKATVSCPAGGLAPGETLTCTASYTITQGDLDAGSVTNTATASGNDLTSNQAQATVNAISRLGISLEKSADPTTYAAVGDVINYTYEITNTSNVTLAGPFSVTDDKTTVSCPAGGLAPGASLTCTASYTITQGDLDTGSVTNTATASGNDLTSNQAQATVNAIPESGLGLTKVADPATYDTVGQVISYKYTILNAGNVTLAGPITVTDNKATVSCPAGGLAPGASMDCTASYTITQGDLDAGSVTNTAVAHADQLDSNQAQATVVALQNPALTIVKTALPLTYTAVGDVISYSYLVTNTGNITVTNLNVVDDKTTVTCPVSSLAPSASTTCTATYTIKAGDLAAGSVLNTAYAEGLYGRERTIKSDDATATVTRFISLGLAAICASDPTVNNGWKLTNNNGYPVDYEITNSDGSYSVSGGSSIPANSSVNIGTPVSAGTFVKLYSAGVLQDSASAATGCVPQNPPPPTNNEPFVPVTGTVTEPPVAIGGTTVLIPVTGVDMSLFGKVLPGSLFNLGLGFLGLGLVMSGIARRRRDQ